MVQVKIVQVMRQLHVIMKIMEGMITPTLFITKTARTKVTGGDY